MTFAAKEDAKNIAKVSEKLNKNIFLPCMVQEGLLQNHTDLFAQNGLVTDVISADFRAF